MTKRNSAEITITRIHEQREAGSSRAASGNESHSFYFKPYWN